MATPNTAEPIGLLFSDDFIWISRITGAAQALGKKIKAGRTLSQVETLAKDQEVSCVILDLEIANLVVADAVQRIRAVSKGSPRFVAFGSHVDVASLRAAREAGCDPVLPRSQFAEQLPALLEKWLVP